MPTPFQLAAEDFRLFRGTAASFPSDYILEAGDMGFETDTGKAKLGDGVTAWSSLAYFNPGTSATATEIERFNDVSAYVETVVGAGALSVSKKVSNLALVGAGAVTLAVPDGTMLGQVKVIEMTVDNGDVTLALTNVQGGTAATTATFDAVGEKLVLIAAADKWVVLKEQGVTLS